MGLIIPDRGAVILFPKELNPQFVDELCSLWGELPRTWMRGVEYD